MAADIERVKDLVECMGNALADYDKDFSAVELLSAEATFFATTAQVIIGKSPEALVAVEALLYHLLATVQTPSGTVH